MLEKKKKKKKKQEVSALGNHATMHIDWLIFFYCNRNWTRDWQAVMSNELSQRPIEQN